VLPDHDRLIRNAPGANFEAMAAAFGQPYLRCTSVDALRAALAERSERIRIIEMPVPARSLLRDVEPLYRAAAALNQ